MQEYPYSNDTILGMLPDLFTFENGQRVLNADDWKMRRREILDSAIELEYGGLPPEPEIFEVETLHQMKNMSSYRIETGSREKTMTFTMQLFHPDGGELCPVVLTGDGCYRKCETEVINEALSRGIAVAKFNRTELAHDMYNNERKTGLYAVYPGLSFSAISAWAWGYHRCVDLLVQCGKVDPSQIAITGHSRGGKTVLLAGATDERIYYTNPNNSGAHGCGCYRYQQKEPDSSGDKVSETMGDLFRAVPYWMGPELRKYIGSEEALPHDMHFIKALVAPRCFLQTEALGDIWANPRGSFQTYLAAKKVWGLFGAQENCTAVYREGGHDHSFADFCVLFDLIDAKRKGQALPEKYHADYFPGMKTIF
jgi:dienelactone hydrolase